MTEEQKTKLNYILSMIVCANENIKIEEYNDARLQLLKARLELMELLEKE